VIALWLALAAESALTQPIPPLELMPRCQPVSGEEIVVCGRPDSQRIREQPAPAEATAIPRAEWRLSEKTKLSLDGESAGLAGGATSNRAMVRLKIKF
jgi:hypothetical protein